MDEIFVSYARQDAEQLSELRTHLKPFERLGKLRLWSDQDIEGGDRWRRLIDQALERCRVAVLLVSKHFLASDFIAEVEMPRLLAREAAGEVTIIPVFIGLCAADRVPFSFVGDLGESREVTVTTFNGFGTPNKPLLARDPAARDYELLRLVRRLEKLVGTVQAPAPRTDSRPEEQAEAELAVILERSGDRLRIAYQQPLGRAFGHRELAWTEVEGRLRAIGDKLGRWRLGELEKWHRGPEALQDGKALFAVLFGEERSWSQVFRHVYGRPATPRFGRLRLRVVTSEALLLDLPWRLLASDGRRLVDDGWILATGSLPDPERVVITEPRHEILVLHGDTKGGPSAHVGAVLDLVVEAWGEGARERCVVLTRREDLERQAPGLHPHLIYVVALATANGAAIELADGPLRLEELAQWRPATQAVVLSLAGCGGCAARAAEIFPGVPLLISRRLAERTADADAAVLGWLGRWLRQGSDPVTAWHQLDSNLEKSSTLLRADYRGWTVERPHRPRTQRVQELIDRVAQKSLVRHEIDELLASDRRVLALLAHGRDGGGAEHAGEQLVAYLEGRATGTLHLRRHRVRLPDVRGGELHRQLEQELEMQLGRLDGETPGRLLRRLAPQIRAPRQPKVLWLDWGTYGGRHGRVKPSEIKAWLRFSHDYFPRHVLDDQVRVVSVLTVEVEGSKLETFQSMLAEMHTSPWGKGPRFRFVDLPPLDKVPEKELWDFLEASTDCPEALRDEMARLLVRQTQGAFEPIVEWIERAEQEGWATVLDQLRRIALPAETGGDEEAF